MGSKMPGIIEEALVAYTYVGVWIGMSAGVILYNKYILTVFGFPFPVALTMIHMAFCSALAFVLVRVLGVVKGINMSRETYIAKIVPIAGLFAVVLWMGNTAYVYLSVAFIQMVKALMPCVVYTVGCAFKVEKYKKETMMNMMVIALGVGIASYGELNFNLTGFMLLMGSIVCEAVRIVSIQLLLTSADIKLNSVTTLYYVSPRASCSFSPRSRSSRRRGSRRVRKTSTSIPSCWEATRRSRSRSTYRSICS